MAIAKGKVEKVQSYCCQCGSLCPLVVHLQEGRLVKVEADKEHPNFSPLCPKGLAGIELLYDPQRLKYPLQRTRPKGDPDPGWQRLSWEEALSITARRLNEIKAKYGPEAVVFNRPGPGGSPASDYNDWLGRLAHAFGSPNVMATGHVCQWHRDTASTYTYGKGGIGIPEFEKAACILVWGHNPYTSSRARQEAIRKGKANGVKLIVVDPRRTEIAAKADLWLQVRPGADGALALSMINVLLSEGIYDRDFTRDWTTAPFLVRQDTGDFLRPQDTGKSGAGYVVWDEANQRTCTYDPATLAFESPGVGPSFKGSYDIVLANGQKVTCQPVFERLSRLVQEYPPEKAEGITGVPAENMKQAARMLGSLKPLCYWTYNGIEQHTNATQTNRAICILYSLTGNYDSLGGNAIYPRLPTNQVRGLEFLSQDVQRKRLAAPERPLGPAGNPGSVQGNTVAQAILTGKPYPVKGLVSIGGNFITANSHSVTARNALRQLDFYVHMDLYLTPSAELADIVLPASTFFEGWFVRFGYPESTRAFHHLQLRPAVVAPLHECRPDLEVMFDLAQRLGLGDRFWNGDIKAAFNYQLAPCEITVDDLEKRPGGVTIPTPVTYQKYRLVDSKTGKLRGFATPSKRIELYSQDFLRHGYDPLPVYQEPALSPVSAPQIAENYPFILTCSKVLQFCHGQHRSLPSLRKAIPYPYLEINPKLARELSIADGEWVLLETPDGSIKLKAKLTAKVAYGVVCTQEGWWQACPALNLSGFDPYSSQGANLNNVFPTDVMDPISGSLPYKAYLCNVKKI